MSEKNRLSSGVAKVVVVCCLLALSSGVVAPAHASGYFIPGDVFLSDGALWVYWPGMSWMSYGGGWILISKPIPYAWPGWFIVPGPQTAIFHNGRMVSFWDGVVRSAWDPGKGYDDLFTDDAELGELVRTRSGHYLVAERWAELPKQAAIIEFDLSGRIREYPFPPLLDLERNRSLGAEHIELLPDGCTLLYAAGEERSEVRRHVRRMNVCLGAAESDFAVLPNGQSVGAIRQLRTGEVLVAADDVILKLSPTGDLSASFVMPPITRFTATVTHVALSPDGSTCYAAGIDQGAPKLYRFDPYAASAPIERIDVGNPGMQPPERATGIHSLVVVGEWRAGGVGARSRAVRGR